MAPPETEAREWLLRARIDLRVAMIALGEATLPPWPAGFHLQQAAEKALKAVLIAHGRLPPRTHDLGLLADTAAALEPVLAGYGDAVLALNEFAVAQRYPGSPESECDLAGIAAEVGRLLHAAEQACGGGGEHP